MPRKSIAVDGVSDTLHSIGLGRIPKPR
jgi:hypothetical protein